jgi:hypothetical protein
LLDLACLDHSKTDADSLGTFANQVPESIDNGIINSIAEKASNHTGCEWEEVQDSVNDTLIDNLAGENI